MLDVESEIEYSKNFNKKLVLKKPIAPLSSKMSCNERAKVDEYEIACEAGDEDENVAKTQSNVISEAKIAVMTAKEKQNMVRVDEDEEKPSRLKAPTRKSSSTPLKQVINRLDVLRGGGRREGAKAKQSKHTSNIENNNGTTSTIPVTPNPVKAIKKASNDSDKTNNNSNDDNEETGNNVGRCGVDKLKEENHVKYSTLPMVNRQKHKRTISVPQRTTADGTKIFYLCDVPKKLRKGLFRFASVF